MLAKRGRDAVRIAGHRSRSRPTNSGKKNLGRRDGNLKLVLVDGILRMEIYPGQDVGEE